MKKILIIYSVFIILATINIKEVNANETNLVKIYIDGQVSIDTQINGVSIDYNKAQLDISDVYIEIDDDGYKKKYNCILSDCIEKFNYNFTTNIDKFSDNAIFTVNGSIKSDELNIDKNFSRAYSKEELANCNEKSEYDIEITSNELNNIITYDVVFKSDDGGILEQGQDNVEYINIIPGEKFPEIPNLIGNNNYNFIGWYDEIQKCFIQEFPESVDQDYIFTAKWESIKNNENQKNANKMVNNETYIPSTSTKENNILLLIVSYIICLTVSM